MRIFGVFLFLMVLGLKSMAQQLPLDSLLKMEKKYLKEDTIRAKLLTDIARRYYAVDPTKGVLFATKAIKLGEKLQDKKVLAAAYSSMGANNLTLANYPAALTNYQKALELNQAIGYQQGIANNYNNIGLVYYSIYDYPRALDYYQRNLVINEKTGNQSSLANTLGNIGAIYNVLKDYNKAIEYYEKALQISEKLGNQQNVAGNYSNLGNVYTQQNDYAKALEYKQRALKLYEKLGNQSGVATNLGNIGNVYRKMNDYPSAIRYHEQALIILDKIKDKKSAAAGYSSLGELYYLQKDYHKAVEAAYMALSLANSSGLINTSSEALRVLSKCFEAQGRFDSAYVAYRGHVLLRDSIGNVEKQTELTKKTLQFEFGKKEDSLRQFQALTDAKLQQQILLADKQQKELELKQVEINLATKELENERQLQATEMNLRQTQLELKDKELKSRKMQSMFFAGGILLLSLLSFFIFRNYLNQQKANKTIQVEKQKSEDLLHNILPEKVADELKENGQALARHFESVTVLFTDFVNFTQKSEELGPQELVNTLHRHFQAFDAIIEKHGLEKIKTIGDAYMAVSGLPIASEDHAQRAANAALEIRDYIHQNLQKDPSDFQIRLGMHSGPVVAGIVGVKKFAYDVWGDTVNTAARMESSSAPGKINLSGSTRVLLGDTFALEPRGNIEAKHKGQLEMFFLEGVLST